MKINKEMVQSIHQLTAMQQGMILNYLSDPSDTTYFEQICLKVTGLYDEEILKETWTHIVYEYDVLRTVFRWKGLKEPIQIILHSNEPEISFCVLENDDNIETYLSKKVQEDLCKGMDLEKVPFRLTFIRESQETYYMLISHHHILYDGWSNGLLINRFYEILGALGEGKKITIYNQTDISVYFNYLKNYTTDNSNAFWKEYLNNYQASSLTKTSSEDEHTSTYIIKKIFEKDMSAMIRRFCKHNGITLATLLFAVLGLSLLKNLNRTDIVIGTTVSGRNLPIKSIDKMVGLFIQTIPLRFQTNIEQSFLDFVKQVNVDIINSAGNQIYSIADIKHHLKVPAEKELFEIIAVAENYPIDTKKLSSQNDFQIQYHTSYDEKAVAPICVEFRLFDNIEIYLKYRKNIVSNTLIENILSSYSVILQRILEYPSQSVYQLVANENTVTELNSTALCSSKPTTIPVKDDEIAKKLKAIWADILEIPAEKISNNANFFDLGGHSLKLTYLILRLQKEFEVGPIKVSYIYKIPTIALMADYICTQKQQRVSIPKQPLQAYYMASPAQKSYYMFQKLYPNSVQYNMISTYVIKGLFKMDKLESALEMLLDKHEGLRTTFLSKNGEVYQHIHKTIKTPLFYLSSEGKTEEQIIQDFIAPFNLSNAPLLKVGVAQIEPEQFLLVFQLHHIISDGISNQILIRDLLDAYNGCFNRQQSVTYKDFSVWQASRDRSKQKQYWQDRLKENVIRTDIIPSCTNMGQQSWKSKTIDFKIEQCKYNKMQRLILRENVSLNSLLLSCWVILLHKLSNQTLITTGTVISGRTHPDIEETVGLFINSLPFTAEISRAQSFHEFLLKVHENFLNDMDNQTYELGEIVNDLHLNRKLNEAPLFNTMFVLQNMKQTEFKLPGVSIKEYTNFQKYTKYDLTLFATPDPDTLSFDMEFRADLFHESLVKLFAQYYVAILDQVIENATLPLCSISILLPEQKQYILHKWNSPISELKNTTVQELFYNQVHLSPDKVAVIDGDRKFTYTELNILSNKVAYFLRTHNVRQGDTVAVYMDNSIALIAGILGILKIGATYLPIDIETPSKRISYILNDSGCRFALIQSDLIFPIEGIHTVNVWNIESLLDMDENIEDILAGAADDPIYIIYTSGTTGTPKGCLIQQKSAVNYLKWAIKQYYNMDEVSTFAFFSSPAFDISITSLFSPLICGQTIVIYRRKLDALYQVLSDNLCNIIKVTPTQLRLLVSKNCSKSKIKTIILGGEQFTVELAKQAVKAFGPDIKLYNEYGPTEATVGCMIHQYDPKIDTGAAVAIGVPAKNMQIYVLDDNMEICPIGVKGEIFIAGIGLSPGYIKQPELNRCVFIEYAFEGELPQRLYKTGDAGVLSENGLLYYAGRLDGQIKFHGYRIETEEVKKAILQIENITDVHVLIEQGKYNDQFLTAYYISKETISAQEIKSTLAEMLPHYMIPDYFYQVDKIPTTLSGKIDIEQLLSFKTSQKPKKKEYRITTDTMDFLYRLWMKYLDVKELDLNDNFFDVGGNSYTLLKMFEELSELYPQVEITDFFKYPTIESFAQFIDENTTNDSNLITTVQTLLPSQHSDSIAVIGIGLQLYGAQSIWELKDVFANKIDCVHNLPTDRKNDLVQYLSYLGVPEASYEIPEAAFLDRIDTFDYKFFKITKNEAELTDPYHRILLETAHRAFEDSGYTKEKVKGSNTGVYIGHPHPTNYYDKIKRIKPELAVAAGPGNVDAIMAGRISYYYDLKGPSIMVNTACSSSLSALYLACQAIRSGEIEMGLVGGINIIADPSVQFNAPVPDIVSSTARARTFSEDSDGTGRGEGCIVILVKQYDKAVQDRDNIYAVIKGAELNNDGKSIGITAPNINMQEKAVQNALRKAGVNPEEIGYIETHGTGTKLGDPVELAALTNVFRRFTDKKQFCALGAAKTNYGHLDSSAGLLGFVKAVVCLRYKMILPNINMTYPNNKIDFMRSPFYLPDETQAWDVEQGHLRYACVSAFGLSGTNCHMVLEEYATENTIDYQPECCLFALSAKSESSLRNNVKAHLQFIQTNSVNNLQNICYTMQTRRDHYKYRIAIICYDIQDLVAKLIRLEEGLFSDPQIGIYYNYGVCDDDYVPEVLYEMPITALEINTIKRIAESYMNTEKIFWDAFYNNNKNVQVEHLPTYAFDPIRCWIDPPVYDKQKEMLTPAFLPEVRGDSKMKQTNQSLKNKVLQDLIQFVANMFDETVETIDKDSNFIELGIDSISIIQLKNYVKTTYEIDVSTDVLFHEWSTIETLTQHIAEVFAPPKSDISLIESESKIEQNIFPEGSNSLTDRELLVDQLSENSIQALFAKQLEILSCQLEILKPCGHNKSASETDQYMRLSTDVFTQQKTIEPLSKGTEQTLEYQHNHAMKPGILTEQQYVFLQRLSERYTARTAASKKLAQQQKKQWANGRFTMGYSKPWKEMIYPIYATRGEGTKIWDEDGNEYIDFAMGFGVHLYGHHSSIITNAIKQQIDQGVYLGPLNKQAGEVASLICELTGVERVAFCNSGTEAIMNLMRIARAASNKNTIAVFSGAFHGTFDGVYMMMDMKQSEKPIPFSLGTPQAMANDIIILPYGEEKSFEVLSAYKDELAAVLVEPVQSRAPELQPVEFLHKLRDFTSSNDIALIFDEIITGFRVHAGGAQAYFGVKADLVAYGKVLGGGMPIGVFAGDKKYMDKVDGGYWQFGDDSGPYTFVAQTGGTFRGHALTMASAKAVLEHLRDNGPELQNQLNQKTKEMAEYLNKFFVDSQIPVWIAYFGSLFIFKSEDATLLRFLFYMLIEKGIYLWEGGTCFVSFVHSDADLCKFVIAVQEVFIELEQDAGYPFSISHRILKEEDMQNIALSIQGKSNIERCLELIEDEEDYKKIYQMFLKKDNIQYILPVTAMQERMISQNIIYKAAHQDIALLNYTIWGALDLDCLKQAWNHILNLHPIFKTGFIWRKLKKPIQVIYKELPMPFLYIDISDQDNQDMLLENLYNKESQDSFDNNTPPLIKVIVVKLSEKQWKLIVKYQNSLFDGWSAGIVFRDLFSNYHALVDGKDIDDMQEYALLSYMEWLKKQNFDEAKGFWQSVLSGLDSSYIVQSSYEISPYFAEGLYEMFPLPEEIISLQSYAKTYRLTLHTLFQGAWGIYHSKTLRSDDILIASVTSGRPEKMEDVERLVGVFSNVVPVRIQYHGQQIPLDQWLHTLQETLLSTKCYDYLPSDEIARIAGVPNYVVQDAIYFKTLVYLNNPNESQFEENGLTIQLEEEHTYINVPLRVYIEPFNRFRIVARYDKNLFSEKHIMEQMEHFKSILMGIVNPKN